MECEIGFTLQKQSLTLKKQVSYYAAVHEGLVQELGSAGAQEHLSKSIFAFVIGSNDILGYHGSDSKTRNKTTPQQFVDSMAATLKEELKVLLFCSSILINIYTIRKYK